MLRNLIFHRLLVASFLLLALARPVFAQTLAIADDFQSFATLPGTTVTMTGRSELRITGTTTPITGSIIHLNSPDSWFFMTHIRPSVVNSNYLAQIRVSGAAAVLNTNCRIVQFGDGTAVIPHSPTFTPFQAFSGSHFTGTVLSLQNHITYNDTSLGALANTISSFKLKRGYSATIAQNANGTGVSKNYVAQDGDIEVSVLPDELNNSVSFIRVIPWRWVGKKGSCDISPTTLDARWHYNWDNNTTSPLDWEYIPIKQQRWWPAYPNDKRESTHVLGYNEPDNPVEDAYTSLDNGSVDAAIAAWPEMLASGLRLGSPAVTDGGEAWLYDFIDKADAARLRVDFVAIHFYRCGYTATQLYNWLYNIHVRTGRMLWVTEFNNGANWTGCADPTLTQNATAIAGFIEMMDNAPFIERYAVYSNVEEVRKMVNSSGVLTPAGEAYQANTSPIAYAQLIPEVPTPPAALYRFENDARDSSASGHPAMLKGGAKFTTGKTGRAVLMSGVTASADCVQLPTTLGDSNDFTFGAWVYPTSGSQWQRIFDLGSGTTSYMFLSPIAGSGNLRFAIKDGGAEQQLNHNAPLPLNTWTHVAVTITGNSGKLFVNGATVATNTNMSINPMDLGTTINHLGKSQFAADPLFAGRLDEVRFLPYALSDSNVALLMTNTPPVFTSSTITGSPATQGSAYNSTIAGSATDADVGDIITYSKVEGPAWLTVAANGSLSGIPGFNEVGRHDFIVYATDSAGATASVWLTIQLPNILSNGTWVANDDGNWSDASKWSGALPANGGGNTANFSTLNIGADRTVTLDARRSIGTLQFGDTSGAQNWTLAATGEGELTLAATTPNIVVNQNTATITAPLAGTAGFTKSGPGTLVIQGDNSLTGTLYVDVGSTNSSTGTVRLAGPNAGNALTGIQIRNNNTGYSTLELDGSSGDVTTPSAAPILLSGRNVAVPAIRNLSGGNTLSGAFTIQGGGGNYYFQSDGGTLILGGAFSASATGIRTLTFLGTGNTTINGVITNGSATVGVVKNDSGILTLAANNTHGGPMIINGGSVILRGSGTRTEAVVSLAAGSTLNINRAIAMTGAVSGAGTMVNTGSNAVTGDFSGFTGSYTHDSSFASSAFNSATATSRHASYHLASAQGSSQGFIAGGAGDHTLELGALSGVAGSLFRGGNVATGTTTLQIGNLNTNTTFAGAIANGATKTIAVTKVGTGTLTLSGVNNYTGNTIIGAGTLALADDGNLKFLIGASGVNNSISGSGAVMLDGDFILDLTGANPTAGNSWTLVNVDSLNETYGSSFTVVGFTESTNVHTMATGGNVWRFTESTGILTVGPASGYAVWSGTHAAGQAMNLDFDHDGIANGVEYFMNATAGLTSNPGLVGGSVTWINGGNISHTDYGTRFVVQTSPDLLNWTNVPVGNLTANTGGPGGSLKYTPPSGMAESFVRLAVTPD